MMRGIDEAARLLAGARQCAVFSGAGLSTESGIPDFRSPGGVWSEHRPVMFGDFMASRQARADYWRFYQKFHPAFATSEPNPGHLALARLFAAGRLAAAITQNIDGLHQQAGIPDGAVIELHGNGRITACMACGRHTEPTEDVLARVAAGQETPDCPLCGGPLKPATVSFGQQMPEKALELAARFCQTADLLVVVGSSLTVYPAAELPVLTLTFGGKLLIINRDQTPLDDRAALVFREPAGQVLSALADAVLAGG